VQGIMRTASGLLILALAIGSAGCSRTPPASSPSPLKFQLKSFVKLLPGCGSDEKQPCVTFRVNWQEVAQSPSPQAQTTINASVLAHLQPKEAPRGFEAESQAVFDDFKHFHDQFPDTAITYFIRRSADVQFSNASLLCIVIDGEEFRGGAHPNSTRTYLNLRPRTGAEVTLKELLNDGALPALTAATEKQFRAERAIAPTQKFSEAGFQFPDDKFTLSAQWSVVPKGLVFHYNAYEVAPYVVGPTTVLVGWSEVSSLLRRDAGIAPDLK